MQYRVSFTRVGRHNQVADLEVDVDSSQALRAAVVAHVRPLLASKLVELNMDIHGGDIYAGDRYVGGFDITPAEDVNA